MRAFPSGALAGLQGLSDTLGGTADFHLKKRGQDADIRYQDQALAQRQREEERRQQAFQLDLEQAQRKVEQEQAQSDYHFSRAYPIVQQRQDKIFEEMLGGPPTVDQAADLQQLEVLTKHIKDPKNAIALVDEWQEKTAGDSVLRGLGALSQEVQRPILEGTVQDPIAQQQLQALQPAIQWLGSQVQSRAIKPGDAPRHVEQVMDRYNSILKDSGARQADLGARQATSMKAKELYSTMDPMKDAQKMQHLMEVEQAILNGSMSPREATKTMLEMAYDVEVILPEEKQAALQQQMMLQVGQQGGVYSSGFAGSGSMGADLPSHTGVSAGMPTTARQVMAQSGMQPSNGQADPKARFAQALRRVKNPTPDQIRTIARRFGVTDLSPEEEEALFGGG